MSDLLDQPALRFVHRYVSPSQGPIVEVRSLRRPDLVLRHTIYRRITVDERLLTRSFRFVPKSTRLVAVVMLEGLLVIHDGPRPMRIEPGQAVLIGGASMPKTRWESAVYLDLEWLAPIATTRAPKKLRPPDGKVVRRLVDAMADDRHSQPSTLRLAFDLFRNAGAAVPACLDRLSGAPTERDRRIALAMEEQIAHLGSRATTTHLADVADLSPRQLQRVVEDFNRRYGINARTWRDTRNRWRVQIAVVLLSLPELTVGQVAKEVGYGSPNALARAFAQAGFSSPAEVRQAMSEKDPLS